MLKIRVFIVAVILFRDSVNCYTEEDEINNSIDFTCNFYRAAFNESKNTVLSPFSLRLLLTTLYPSSRENSENELRNILKLGPKSEILNVQNQNADKLLKGSYVKLANKLYLPNHELFLSFPFSSILWNSKTSFERADFSNGGQLADEINGWAESQTYGFIKNFVSRDEFTSNIELLLLNAIYFEARWLGPYYYENVSPRNFTSYNGQIHLTNMMTFFSFINYTKSDFLNSEIIELPYTVESNYVFWAILPEYGETIKNVADKLNSISIRGIKNSFQNTEMYAVLPVYDSELDTDTISVLKKMGLEAIFANDADLNILEYKQVKVDKIKQKAKINFIKNRTVPKIHPKNMGVQLNRPFIYLILTADTSEPLFIGHYSNSAQ